MTPVLSSNLPTKLAQNCRPSIRSLQEASLCVRTGDLGVDAAGQQVDLCASRDWLAGLGAPIHCVPGMHDVGDRIEINPRQPVNNDQLRLCRDAIDPDRWLMDRQGWRLIGLNAMFFGTV